MTQQRSENTRDQIITAAIDLFCRSGYDATGVAEICERAGVSKGAFYHHFPSKKNLFLAIMHQWLDGIDAQLAAFREPGKPVPQTMQEMANAIGSIFTVASGQLPMFLEFMVQASRNAVVWDATIAPYQTYQQQFARLLAEGQQEGSVRPDLDVRSAAWVLIAFAVGVLLQGVVMPVATDWNQVTQTGMRMLTESMQRSDK